MYLCSYTELILYHVTLNLCVCLVELCVFFFETSYLYVGGPNNDYFLLNLETKFYIVCLLIWSSILYVYLIKIPYVCECLYPCLFMNICM